MESPIDPYFSCTIITQQASQDLNNALSAHSSRRRCQSEIERLRSPDAAPYLIQDQTTSRPDLVTPGDLKQTDSQSAHSPSSWPLSGQTRDHGIPDVG